MYDVQLHGICQYPVMYTYDQQRESEEADTELTNQSLNLQVMGTWARIQHLTDQRHNIEKALTKTRALLRKVIGKCIQIHASFGLAPANKSVILTMTHKEQIRAVNLKNKMC